MFFRKEKREIKKWEWLVILAIIVLSLAAHIYYSWYWPKAKIKIGGQEILVLLARTPKHRQLGWGGRKDMGEYGGMLFVFPSRGQHAMVMRDMRFPLDIVWVDNGVIVDIAPNVLTEPGRSETELTPYLPRLPAAMVLELPAGFTRKYGVKIGDEVEVFE